ncbi:ATP-binding cassette domain-containing protein [Exiguobacterium sp. SH3S2]|uniref:ABC transporter ATP-binding protein n=1 Tax=unclassified Exiguobacterium TaxID=2644629 RepID=UPI001040959A|nr:ATP-binding cassette domain-containing protein [Exiguobacterium sp. SH3S3]TCI49356.1 ATP-binding cassette domain-containing protein [Exiguobacterium sp. SH3S3]TCI64669.1 ATP-binding cassette domain-containing protein [Exiguobacterium sp. SH3S2]
MLIEFQNVSKRYDDGTLAVANLSLTVRKGEIFVLIGPSGCGKTTTMKMVNRLIDHTDGKILIDEREIYQFDIYELRRNIGYVLQQIALFPHLTVEENIAVVPDLLKWPKTKTKDRVTELMKIAGLDPVLRSKKPPELSGGQQQRVGVLRALAADPEVILMDEPFSALDPISRAQLQDDIKRLNDELGKTILFVTHDIEEAMKLGDRIALMRDGKLVVVGTPDEIRASDDPFVLDFTQHGRGEADA